MYRVFYKSYVFLYCFLYLIDFELLNNFLYFSKENKKRSDKKTCLFIIDQ